MDNSIFTNDEERHKHENMIKHLAREFGMEETSASVLYEEGLRQLGTQARIRHYLPVLMARHFKEALREGNNRREGKISN